jgi:hypothetical protein
MSLDPLLTPVVSQFSRMTLDETATPAHTTLTKVHLKKSSGLPEELEIHVNFPQEWYDAAYSRLDAIYQAKVGYDTLATTINRLITTLNEFPTAHPLLQQTRITGSDLYRIFGWSHLQKSCLHVKNDSDGSITENLANTIDRELAKKMEGLADSITVRFMLRPNFYDLFRFIYTTSERCKAHYPNAIHIPFSYQQIKNRETVAEFGVIAQLDDKNIKIHFEFVTDYEQECFATAEGLQFAWGSKPDAIALCDKEQWLLDNLFKRVDVLQSAPLQMEKLLNYLQSGYTPTTAALTLFKEQYWQNSAALQLLFNRRIAGKTNVEALDELFVITSLLQEGCPKDFLQFALNQINDSSRSAKKVALQLVLDGIISYTELFSIEEIFCRLKHTRPSCGIFRDIPPTFLQIPSDILKRVALVASDEESSIGIPKNDSHDLKESVQSASYSVTSYLAALALAQSDRSQEMLAVSLLYFPEASANSPFKNQIFMGMHYLLETLNLKIPSTTKTWAQFLLETKNSLCVKIGMMRAQFLSNDEIKPLIKALLARDLPLALRLIEQRQENASDRDMKEWIHACNQKPLLLDVLTKNDNPRWIALCADLIFAETVSFYQSLTYTRPQAAKRLVEVATTNHMAAVLHADTAQKTPEFFAASLTCVSAGSYSFDKPVTEALRSQFRPCLEAVKNSPATFLALVKLHQELCKDALSNQLKKEVRVAYESLGAVSESLKKWYTEFDQQEKEIAKARAKAAIPKPTIRAKSWKERAIAATIDPVGFAELITDLSIDSHGLDATVWNDVLACATTSNLEQSFILFSFRLPELPGIDETQLLRVLAAFIEIVESNPKIYRKHARKLHEWFFGISDDVDKIAIARRLLKMSSLATDREIFEENARLVESYLEGIVDVDHSPSGNLADIVESIMPFLESAKHQHKNPFDIPAVLTLFKTVARLNHTRELDQTLFTYLSRYCQQEQLGHFSGLIMRQLEHNITDAKALKLACLLLTGTNAISRVYALQKLSNPALLALPEFVGAACQSYYITAQECTKANSWQISEAVLSIDISLSEGLPVELMKKMRANSSSHLDVMINHFIIYLAEHGWNRQSSKFIEHLVDISVTPMFHFAEVGELQGCTILDTPHHVREHYPIDSSAHEDFRRICVPILNARKRSLEISVGQRAYVQLLTTFIMQVALFNRDVKENNRSCLLHFATFSLGQLIDTYPYYAQVPRLLQLLQYAVSQGEPLYPAHLKVMHTLLQRAKGKDISLTPDLESFYSTTSLQSYPKIEDIEKKIDFLLAKNNGDLVQTTLLGYFREFLLWQQHTAVIPLADRLRVLKKIMQLWSTHPKEEDLGKFYFLVEAVMFPYTQPIDSNDIFVIDHFLDVYDRYTEALDPQIATVEYMLVNEQTVGPIAILSYTINLFQNVTYSRLFQNKRDSYRLIAERIMALIGPDRRIPMGACVPAIASFTQSVTTSFGEILPAAEQINLITNWIKIILKLTSESKIGPKVLHQLVKSITVSQIAMQFTEAQIDTLRFWLDTFASVEEADLFIDEVKQLPFYPKMRKE